MEVKVRVKGVSQYIRQLARAKQGGWDGAIRGVVKAAEYLMERVQNKFGRYQSTGGKPKGNGPWPRLKYESIARKVRRGQSKDPLVATGAMRNSFSVVKGGAGRISASVGSSDPKLIHHIYGAPRAGVPQRDPIRVTAEEERGQCADIIEKEIKDGWKRGV